MYSRFLADRTALHIAHTGHNLYRIVRGVVDSRYICRPAKQRIHANHLRQAVRLYDPAFFQLLFPILRPGKVQTAAGLTLRRFLQKKNLCVVR